MNKRKFIYAMSVLSIISTNVFATAIKEVPSKLNINYIAIIVCSLISIGTAIFYINSVKKADEEVRRKRSEAAIKAAKTRKKNENKNKKETKK